MAIGILIGGVIALLFLCIGYLVGYKHIDVKPTVSEPNDIIDQNFKGRTGLYTYKKVRVKEDKDA